MRIRLIEIENFRGIRTLRWAPAAGLNCLIGPGDATKTTVLDALELALNPRGYFLADDSDFYNLDYKKPIAITVTIGELPIDFIAENKYGLHLRGWNAAEGILHDEPGHDLEYVLSVRVVIEESLEGRWALFNERIAKADSDPPMIRYKDMERLATSRLGPFADRHLGWGRQSVLSQIEQSGENVNLRLAEASRAARQSFKSGDTAVFSDTVAKVQKLGTDFLVPVRDKYKAGLDIRSVSISAGGIALHDGDLPLRRLGTGSARLLVSALQHEAAAGSHMALIDEIEHGLEPHRIARLLKYLKGLKEKDAGAPAQIFMTTHSPVVIRELTIDDLHAVHCRDGNTGVKSIASASPDVKKAQAHVRASPEAFLARAVIVGEGRTEQGFARGLDMWWAQRGQKSFAYQGIVAIDGGGIPGAPDTADSLLTLGYAVLAIVDSDEPPDAEKLEGVRTKGGVIIQWEGDCAIEERIFLDVPWPAVRKFIELARELFGDDSILARINNALKECELEELSDLALPVDRDGAAFRRALGTAAKKAGWFKTITTGERMAPIVAAHLPEIPSTPLAKGVAQLRQWVDEQP